MFRDVGVEGKGTDLFSVIMNGDVHCKERGLVQIMHTSLETRLKADGVSAGRRRLRHSERALGKGKTDNYRRRGGFDFHTDAGI